MFKLCKVSHRSNSAEKNKCVLTPAFSLELLGAPALTNPPEQWAIFISARGRNDAKSRRSGLDG